MEGRSCDLCTRAVGHGHLAVQLIVRKTELYGTKLLLCAENDNNF